MLLGLEETDEEGEAASLWFAAAGKVGSADDELDVLIEIGAVDFLAAASCDGIGGSLERVDGGLESLLGTAELDLLLSKLATKEGSEVPEMGREGAGGWRAASSFAPIFDMRSSNTCLLALEWDLQMGASAMISYSSTSSSSSSNAGVNDTWQMLQQKHRRQRLPMLGRSCKTLPS